MATEITFFENWYAEPFTKRKSCEIPGQCGGDCNCGCPYNTMNEVEKLPRISDFLDLFPNEWLAFITSPDEDDDPVPTHGKLVAHSPSPDEIFDAQNTVLWNQCVYIFFNGDFAAMEASYGSQWEADVQATAQTPTPESQGMRVPPTQETVPDNLFDLIYSALDRLYLQPPQPSEAIRRLRLAKVRAGFNPDNPLLPALDQALDELETETPDLETLIWNLEEQLADLEPIRTPSQTQG